MDGNFLYLPLSYRAKNFEIVYRKQLLKIRHRVKKYNKEQVVPYTTFSLNLGGFAQGGTTGILKKFNKNIADNTFLVGHSVSCWQRHSLLHALLVAPPQFVKRLT